MGATSARQFHLTIGSRFENIELVQMAVDEALGERGVSDDVRRSASAASPTTSATGSGWRCARR